MPEKGTKHEGSELRPQRVASSQPHRHRGPGAAVHVWRQG